ncbi:uncharacterized protein LOC114754727 [Neltuma alba]|uniref:uncharacterized protein LOC114754727 n=1 Tax=Neltuma alba TaxID=207710 RepID=UPI0010A359CD|nr:uncharacterized protein LOC114754727 [Prosopis alba]
MSGERVSGERAAEGGGSDESDGRDRNKKKYKSVSTTEKETGDALGVTWKETSYKEKLLDAEPKACSIDGRGSNVFDGAWGEYIDSLKSFFGDGNSQNSLAEDSETVKDDTEELIPTLVVTREEYERWCAPWRRLLIIKILGKDIPLWGIKTSLQRLWKTTEPFETRDIDNGYFVVSFANDKDLQHVYFDGPWMVADHYLLVQRWRPNFDPWSAESQSKIAAWVRIPLLPLEFFNSESLEKIGRLLGRTLKVDSITYLTARGRYARICIELDLKKRLKAAIKIFGNQRVMEYEGLHLICFHCGKYGHHRDQCLEGQATRGESKEADKDEPSRSTSSQEGGPTSMKCQVDDVAPSKDSQKRISTTEGSENRSRDNEQPGKEVLGAWNLVKRPARRRQATTKILGHKETRSARSSQWQSHGKGARESRMINESADSEEILTARFVHGTTSDSRKVGRDTTNNRKWVPVTHNRRIKGQLGQKEKENISPRTTHLRADLSNPVKPSSRFLMSSNPFEALVGQDADENHDQIDEPMLNNDNALSVLNALKDGSTNGSITTKMVDLELTNVNGPKSQPHLNVVSHE